MTPSQIILLAVFTVFLIAIIGYFFVKRKDIDRTRVIALVIALIAVVFGLKQMIF